MATMLLVHPPKANLPLPPHPMLSHSIPKCAEETHVYQRNDSKRRANSDCMESLTVDEERDVTVSWLEMLNEQFSFRTRTFFLAVSYLDATLSRARVKPAYIRCLATASFMLAAKVNEETEHQPLLRELVLSSNGAFSSNDLIRMEKLVCQKIEWNLSPVTADSLLMSVYESCTEQPMATVYDELPEPIEFAVDVMKGCIARSSYLRFSMNTLAVASLFYVIKRRGVASLLLESSDAASDEEEYGSGGGGGGNFQSHERTEEAEAVWTRIEDLFTTYASHIDRESVDECVDEMVAWAC